jgi:hypothetical protein
MNLLGFYLLSRLTVRDISFQVTYIKALRCVVTSDIAIVNNIKGGENKKKLKMVVGAD